MKNRLFKLTQDQSGITALETAIILIAFVVVAAVFAFTVLSTGTFLTERSKEAAYAGLQEVRGSMELKGSMVLDSSTPGTNTGDLVVFNLATVAGGSSVDLSTVKITYRDATHNTDLTYDNSATAPAHGVKKWIATDYAATPAAVKILSAGSQAKITVAIENDMTANSVFALEIRPPTGGVMLIERTVPAAVGQVTDLH
jgi:flagellin FlaB